MRQTPRGSDTATARRRPRRSAAAQNHRWNFLPYDIPDFAGRAEELHRLLSFGTSHAEKSGHSFPCATVAAIDGMAGIGKTALAIHAAHRLADRYPDGQLFVDLRAHTAGQTPVTPGAALEVLLRQSGVPADRIPASTAERSALWRVWLAGRRVVAVLDNAADADQIRPLLPGASASVVIVTSRRRLVDLDGARALSMELLPPADAVALFGGVVGRRADAEPLAVLDVLQLCGFLPLAVRIAAARLNHRPRWTVAYLADRLRDERRRLTELSTADRGVAAAFTLSYQQLTAGQRGMFRLLGLVPGRDIDPSATAALALHRELGNQRGEALVLDKLGLNHRGRGEYGLADARHREAAELYRRIGNRSDEAAARNGVAETALAAGDPDRAITEHRTALTLARDTGNRPEQARAHDGLARAHRVLGELTAARAAAEDALSCYTALSVPEAEDVRTFLAALDGGAVSGS